MVIGTSPAQGGPLSAMNPANSTLRADTLIEAIVASVIFLLVFGISLETISRLSLYHNQDPLFVEVDYRLKSCFEEFSGGSYEYAVYHRKYTWGTITIDIKPYKEYSGIQEITLSAKIKHRLQSIEYRHLVKEKQ